MKKNFWIFLILSKQKRRRRLIHSVQSFTYIEIAQILDVIWCRVYVIVSSLIVIGKAVKVLYPKIQVLK